jgi:hypothetical protein
MGECAAYGISRSIQSVLLVPQTAGGAVVIQSVPLLMPPLLTIQQRLATLG